VLSLRLLGGVVLCRVGDARHIPVAGVAAGLQLVSELFENEYAYDADNPSDYQDDCDTGQCE
jgi:hypothetical protein